MAKIRLSASLPNYTVIVTIVSAKVTDSTVVVHMRRKMDRFDLVLCSTKILC